MDARAGRAGPSHRHRPRARRLGTVAAAAHAVCLPRFSWLSRLLCWCFLPLHAVFACVSRAGIVALLGQPALLVCMRLHLVRSALKCAPPLRVRAWQVDGPYGSLSVPVLEYQHVILVAGGAHWPPKNLAESHDLPVLIRAGDSDAAGVGITPVMSILSTIVARQPSRAQPYQVRARTRTGAFIAVSDRALLVPFGLTAAKKNTGSPGVGGSRSRRI